MTRPVKQRDRGAASPGRTVWLRRLLVLIAVLVPLSFGIDWLLDFLARAETEPERMVAKAALGTLLVAYAGLLAVPFMPGVEIGLWLMLT